MQTADAASIPHLDVLLKMVALTHSYWQRFSPHHPGEPEYMEVLPDLGEIVSAAVIQDDPIRYIPIAVDYEVFEPGSIKTRLTPDSSWQQTTYRVEENTFYWTHAGREWLWKQITKDELPEWFPDFATKALRRMEERATKAEQDSAGLPEKRRESIDSLD